MNDAQTTAGASLDALLSRLEEFVPDVLRATGTPGVNVAVARAGGEAVEAAFGLADIAKQTPLSTSSVIRAASLSKLYTATAVMQLVEAGDLDLFEPISRYVPDLPLCNPHGERPLTSYDLLTFRSGLRTDSFEARRGESPPLREYVHEALGEGVRREYGGLNAAGQQVRRWSAKTGARWQYSNLGVAILGVVVEATNQAGLAFGDYVKTHIFDPLGMTSTALPHHLCGTKLRAMIDRVPTGYSRFGPLLIPCPWVTSDASPAAALLTTAGDHLRWQRAMLRLGEYNGARILGADSVRMLATPQVSHEIAPEFVISTGLLADLYNVGERDFYFGQTGGHPWGWWSEARSYPHRDVALVIAVNQWDMLRWYNPPDSSAIGVIADFLLAEIDRGDRLGAHGTIMHRSWPWKLAFAAGVMTVERTNAMLGLADTVDQATFEKGAQQARAIAGGDVEFDEGGFVAGVRSAMSSDLSPSRHADLVAAVADGIPQAELPAVVLALGGKKRLPLPMPFYAIAD